MATCPKGHDLDFHLDTQFGCRCDGCGKRGIKSPENVWRCKKCDYDLCRECYEKAPALGTAGYAQATAPPVPVATAPPIPGEQVPVIAKAWITPPTETVPIIAKSWTELDPKELEKCSWLFAEALRLEDQAAEFDRGGKTKDALFHHQRAAMKLQEGLDASPPQHPDKVILEEYLSSIQMRMVYLESLGTSPATMPLEDHIDAIKLTYDVSSAKAPHDQTVSALVAKTGVTGSTAELNDAGFQLVAALKNDEEMKVFMNRVLLGDGVARKVQAGAEANFQALVLQCSGEKSIQSFAQMKFALLNAPWIELVLDPARDKLELAMALQNEAVRLETESLFLRASEMYKRSTAIIEFVLKRDPRMNNEKVKAMVTGRLEDLKRMQVDVEAKEAVRIMGS